MSQTSPEDVATRIDDYLNGLAAAKQISGSVLVADDGEILISKGYGLANIEHGVPNTPQTKFRIGSVTKQFTAMAIMMLQEQGFLTVQDPICMYVPECAIKAQQNAWESITIHHLLTNTSGIPDFMTFPDIWEFLGQPKTIDDTMAYFGDRPLDFSPGTEYKYSNSGYVVLGYIVKDMFDPMLMAHWKLDEAEGMTAFDSVADHHAQVKGGATWQPQGGAVDGALEFDGVSSFVVTDSPVNPSESLFSVFAWVKGGAPGQVIVSQQGGANWLMADASQGALVTQLKSGGRSASKLSSAATITDADWHLVGLSWDGSHRRLYADNMLVAEDTQDRLADSSATLVIGSGKNMTTGTFWSGLIDDVRIYDGAAKP